MATEADTPKPVPLMETVNLTAEELNQPPEPTDYLLKSVRAHESINLQDGAAHFDNKDDLGASKGESFLKSSLEAELASEDTCRKQEPFQAVKMPDEAEKDLEENEKQIHTERVSKETYAAIDIIDTAQNVGESSEFLDSTQVMKIEDPELEVQETILSDKKINQVEEIVEVNIEIEENSEDYRSGKTTKTGGYADAETSKEIDKPDGIFDQNTEVSTQTTNLPLNRTDGSVKTNKEAYLKDETENSTVGTNATHVEGSVTVESAAAAEEKQPESCFSYGTIKLSEKERSNDSIAADSLCTHNDQIAISESKDVAEDEPDMPSVSPATYSSAIEETDLIVHETEKVTSAACPSESQERKVEDSAVTEDTVKEIPEEIGVSEVVEKQGKTDRSQADKVKDEINPEQGVDVNNDDSISNKMDVSPTESTEKIEIAEVEISNAAENEKLAKVQDVDDDEKEFNHNRTNTEEMVEKKEDSCDIQMPKLETSEMPDENLKYNPQKVTSEEVSNTAFVEENTEQRSQPGDPQEAEPINEDTVNISQGIVEVAEASGKEDDDKQITEESFKSLSQKSVDECVDENFQNEQKSTDISSREVVRNLVHQEAETGKPVDDISSDTTQNYEISASTLQTYQEKEVGSLQTEEVTISGPSALDLQNNESVENLQEITGGVTAETEKDDFSKTVGTGADETVQSPQNNVIEEETQNDEKKSENSNIESLETSEKDETSKSTVEACLSKEEILKDENSTPKEASEIAQLHGNDTSKIKDEQLENNAVQTEVNEEIEESMEHEENLEYTQMNKPVENQEQPNIVEPSETKNHASDEMIKDLEVETVDKNGSDIKEDNAEGVVINKDENDRNNKAESKTNEKDKFDQADNAEVETSEEGIVDKKEGITTVETVTENNLQKVVDDADVETIEKEATEVETVEGNGLDKNAENAEGVIVETIKEENVTKIDKADSTCNEAEEDTGEQEDLKEQKMNDINNIASLECAEPSPLHHSQTDAKNAEDSNDKDIELSKSAEKHENIADDTNLKDEIPSTIISTSLAEEAEKSHEECESVPPSQTSPDKKEEENVSRTQMVNDNEITAALADTYASVNEELYKEVNDSDEKNQNEESTNTVPQTSRVAEQEILERDNQAEAQASPAELKDEDKSYIKTDETNDNDAMILEVEEEKQKEKLKDDEPNSMIFEETMADGSSKTTGELENAKTSNDLGKDSEVAKEENAMPEAHEETNQNSSRERILWEFETVSSAENSAQKKDQKDESTCTTDEYANATSAEVSTDEHRENDDTPIYSGEDNDFIADKREVREETSKSKEIMEQSTEKKQMEGVEETSKNEEKLEEEPPKNQPEELLEQSSNAVNVETDAVTLSERAKDTRLGEVETIQNDEVKIEEGGEEKEETGKINEGQVEKAAMEEVSAETNVSVASYNTGKLAPSKEETEIDILSPPAEIETSLTEAQVEEKVKQQDASDTVEQALEENTVKDQPSEIADEKMNEEEMIIFASKQEVNEIIRTAERDDSIEKQTIEDKAKEPKTETDKENSEENEIEKEFNEAELKEEVEAPKSEASITTEGSNYEEGNKNESNVAELKEEVEEPKSDAVGIIETSGFEEAKRYIISETKEGSEPLPASRTDSLPEISSSKSEDRDDIIEKEEPNRNDISSLSVTEEAKDISLSEPLTDDNVQTESSIPTSEESELKLNLEETTPNYVNTEVSEEQTNKGENKDQETPEAVDQVKEDTDKLEKETNSEGGGTVKSEASSKEAIETEKSDIEEKEEDIGTKAEVDISNETVKMDESAIIFEEAISKKDNSTTKAEVSSKEDAAMNGETFETEVPISAEEHSVKEVEEESSKEAMEVDKFATQPETAILEGALTTKPVASSKEAIEGGNKETKPEEVISKEEYSAKDNESLREVKAGKITVKPEIAASEAENPTATVVKSSETAIEGEKAENEPDAAAIKEGDSAKKAEVALNEDVEAEKEATQPEVAISQEVDQATEVEESFDATITKEEDSTKNAEVSLKEVEAEKFAVEPEIATSEAKYPIEKDELSSETAAEAKKEESEPLAAAAFKERDSAEATSHQDVETEKDQPEVVVSEEVNPVTEVEDICEVKKTESEPEAAAGFKERHSATKAEATLHNDIEAAKDQQEVVVSEEVDPATEVEDICDVAISEGEDLATKVKESSEVTNIIHPEVVVSREVDSITKIEASSEADTSVGGNLARKVEAGSKEDIKEEKVETISEVAVSEGEDLVTKLEANSDAAIQEEKAKIEPEAVIPMEKDSATDEAASEEDTAVQKSTTQPEVAILEEVDSLAKLEIEHEGAISEERDSAAELKADSEDDVVVEKSTTEPELTISEEAGSAMKVGGITKEAEWEKVDIEPGAAIFEENSGAEMRVAEFVETEKLTEPEVAIYEEVDSTTTIGQSTQEAGEVEKQVTEPEADISRKKDSTTAFEAASEYIEAQKSTTPEVAIPEEVDLAIMIGASTKEAYEAEKQDTEPEADISKEEDSPTEFEATSEDVKGYKSTTEPDLPISEEVKSVAKVGGSTIKADEVEKQETEPEVISKEKDSSTEFEVDPEGDEVQKSITEVEAAISEEAVISQEKDSTAEVEVAKEEDAEVQKSTTEPEVVVSEEVYAVTNIGESTKEADKVEKQDVKPEAAMSTEKDSVTECDAASEKDAELQKLTFITEVAILEEVDSVTKVEKSINEAHEVEKSDTCVKNDSEAEASLTKADEAGKEVICEDTKVEASLNDADEVEKVTAGLVASVYEAEDSDAKVEITNDNAEEEKEAAEPEASICEAEDSDAKVETTNDNAEEDKEAAEPKASICEAEDSDTKVEMTNDNAEEEKEAAEPEASICEAEDSDAKIEMTNDNAEEEKEAVEPEASICEAEDSDAKVEMTNDNAEEEKEAAETAAIQRDLVTEAELSKEAVDMEKETTKAEEAISEAVASDRNLEYRSVDAAKDEKAPMELDRSDPEDESKANKIHETQMYLNVESNEPGKKAYCSSEIGPSDQGDEIVSEATQIKTENRNDALDHRSKSTEKSLRESQDIQLDIQEKVKVTVEEKAQKIDDTIEAATLSTEVHGDAEINDVKALDTVSVQEERINDVNVPSLERIGSVNATESDGNEAQKIAETSFEEAQVNDKQVQVPNIPSNSCSQRTEIEGSERNIAVETVESQVLSSDLASETSKVVADENEVEVKPQDENAGTVEESRKESDPDNVEVAESKTDSDIIEEFQKQELCSAETGEDDDVTKSIFKNQIEEAVIEKEIIVLQENLKEETKEQQEIASPVMPSKEEACETKATEEMEQNEREILSKADETAENSSSEQKTTEEVKLQQQEPKVIEVSTLEPEIKSADVYTKYKESEKKEQSLGEMKNEIKQSFVGVEPPTEVLASSDQTRTEKTSEVQNKLSPEELVIEEQVHGTWTVIEKKEQSIDETELLKHITKETEESCFDKEESKKPEVSSKEATETQVGLAIDENLPKKTAASDKILDCETETCEETVPFGLESRSHGGLVESEVQTDPKVPVAALTQSITEENMRMEIFEQTESIPNEENKGQIELEKEGAKDCPSISHGEETTEDRHVEFKLKAQDSKRIEEVHAEEEEIDARKTIVDQIDNEKRTVEQPRQDVAEDIMEQIVEKETRELKAPSEEDKSEELSKEVPTSFIGVTNQKEYFNATPENQITREAEPGKTTEVTTTDRCVETTEKIEEIAESTESAKISLLDMMQRSTREKQVTTQECEPRDEEANAGTEERTKSDEAKDDREDDEEHKKNDSGSDDPVMLEASKDIEVKVPHKKSHNILSGVGSKVKHSISKVKKAITGKSSHSKQNSPKSGTKEQVNPGN